MTVPARLACAGCGAPGRRSTIVWDRSAPEAQVPVLVPVFGWGDEGACALLCPTCRGLFHKPKRKRKAASGGQLL
jgi:hypothetical protein